MATELFHVFYDIQHGGGGGVMPPQGFGAATVGVGGGGDGFTEFSKEEAERMTGNQANEVPKRFGTSVIRLHGPIMTCKVITGEWETATIAAKFVKYVMGGEVLGVLAPFSNKGTLSNPLTTKEEAEKPMNTVLKGELKATAAT